MNFQIPWRLLTCLLLARAFVAVSGEQRPNIIVVLVDDAGYGDFSFTGEYMNTSNIDKLREEGMFLSQSYVMPTCAPSRAALMTGRYPHTYGSQDSRFGSNRVDWLDENFTILPQEMQKLGYRTHALGKWHLSHCHPGLAPTGRGFDTFYGFLTSSHDSYYNHTKKSEWDWFDGNTPDKSTLGHYQTDLLNARAVKIINETEPDQPFFMYLAYGAPHSPIEAPKHYEDTFCSNVPDAKRRTYCAMMAALDKGVGEIMQTLKDKGLYDNTIILFLSDNGGAVSKGSSNWPLRGGKQNLYEGGIRSYTILKAPGLARTNVTWPYLIHETDWLSTLVQAADGSIPDYPDGMALWEQLKNFQPSARNSFIVASDYEMFNHTLLRFNEWKLMGALPGLAKGSLWKPGHRTGWYPPFQEAKEKWHQKGASTKYKKSQYLLYNLNLDPYEKYDLSKCMPDKVDELKAELRRLLKKYPLQRYRPREEFTLSKYASINGTLSTCFCNPPALVEKLNITCPED